MHYSTYVKLNYSLLYLKMSLFKKINYEDLKGFKEHNHIKFCRKREARKF